MTKVEFVEKIAQKSGFTKHDSEKALDSVFESIGEFLKAGEKVVVSGFGTFEVKERAAKVGHDPRTKQAIQIPASKGVKFKPGKALKELVK